MDEKLAKTLATTDFEAWRSKLWKEISLQAIGEGWVPQSEITQDGVINPRTERWASLWETLVEIRYLFRPPVSRSVHARFRQSAKGERKVGVRFLSFHTSPHPTAEDKVLFEQRRSELLEWRANGGIPPKTCPSRMKSRSPKSH